MLLAYLVAATVAAAAAYGAADYQELPYWRRWDRGMVRAVLGLICLFFAVVGIGVVALAQHFDLLFDDGTGAAVANGVIWGGATFVLLRVEFTGFGLSQVGPARSLLKLYLARIEPTLTRGADRNVRRRIGDLRPKDLCHVSLALFLKYVEPELREDLLERHLEKLNVLHVQALAPEDPEDPADWVTAHTARGLLRHRCERLIVDNRDADVELPVDDVPERRPDA
jgi:hypothetical protein